MLAAVVAVPAAAQPRLDKVLGAAPGGYPFTVSGGWPQLVGGLARATGVPMGVEYVAPGILAGKEVTLSGLTLRDALDTIARVGRMQWREMDGVIVIRPAASWLVGTHPLELHVDAVRLDDAVAQQALAVACAVLGAAEGPLTRSGDGSRSASRVAA